MEDEPSEQGLVDENDFFFEYNIALLVDREYFLTHMQRKDEAIKKLQDRKDRQIDKLKESRERKEERIGRKVERIEGLKDKVERRGGRIQELEDEDDRKSRRIRELEAQLAATVQGGEDSMTKGRPSKRQRGST
jgi:chromosome segregation ATPase